MPTNLTRKELVEKVEYHKRKSHEFAVKLRKKEAAARKFVAMNRSAYIDKLLATDPTFRQMADDYIDKTVKSSGARRRLGLDGPFVLSKTPAKKTTKKAPRKRSAPSA